MPRKGFVSLPVLIAIVLGVVVIGAGGYFVWQMSVQNQTQNNPPTGPVSQTNGLAQLLSSSEESKEFFSELQRLNPKLDINKAILISERITSVSKPATLPNITDPKWLFSPNGKNAFYDSSCFREGDRGTLDVMITNDGNTEVKTIFNRGTSCPRGNGFWLSDTKLAYLNTSHYAYYTLEEQKFPLPPASPAVEILIFDLIVNNFDDYFVKSPDAIRWPPLSYEDRRRNLAVCEERHGVGDSSCLGFSSASQVGFDISSDGKSIFDYNGKILFTMRDMLLSEKFISFAKENNFQRYDDPAHSSFLKIVPLPQFAFMISSCLNCNEDLYSYDVTFITNELFGGGVSRYFQGRDPRLSSDRNFVMLRNWGGGETTAFNEFVYDISTAKLIGDFSSRGTISDFAQKSFNIIGDTFVTFEFSPDSKSIIITPHVYDGNNYKPFASKLIADLDGKNLRKY